MVHGQEGAAFFEGQRHVMADSSNEYEAFESNFHPFETQSQSKRLQDGAHIAQEAHTFGISICFVCVDQGWEDSVYVDLSQPLVQSSARKEAASRWVCDTHGCVIKEKRKNSQHGNI